jgi:PAS domain S-box-containing protein
MGNIKLDAEVLGQLLLMQSILINLPDKKSIFSFVTRGLIDIPGVEKVQCLDETIGNREDPVISFPLGKKGNNFGVLQLKINDIQSFKPYEKYLQNFIFVIEVVLEEQYQRQLIELQQSELEKRVEERTQQLSDEINERKLIEESLKHSEEIFRTSFENTAAGVCMVGLDGSFMKINTMFSQILGYSENELIGKNFNDITYLDDRDIGRSILEDMVSGKVQTANFEKRYIRDNGRIILASVSTAIVRNKIKERQYFITYIQDISEQRKVQSLLKSSEQKYRSLFENMTTGFGLHKMIYDKHGNYKDYRFIEVNPAYERLTGLKSENLIGRTVKEVLPNIEQYWIETFGRVAKTGEPIAYQNFTKALNKYFDTWTFCTEKDKFAVIFTDVTNRVFAKQELAKNEKKLKEQNEEYEALNEELNERNRELIIAKEKAELNEKNLQRIIDHSPLPMVISVENNYVEFVNRKFTQLYGYTQKDIPTSEKWYQSAYPDEEYRQKVLKTWRLSIENAARLNVDVEPQVYTMITKDGSKRECEFYTVLLGNKGVIVVNDITERKNFENELIKAKEKAEESDRLKTAFLQNMSHEIRTPMNAIMGFSSILTKHFDNKAKLEKFTEIITQRCKDLLVIINDILDIAQIESGQLPLNIEQVDLYDLFNDLFQYFRELQIHLNKQHIPLNLQIPSYIKPMVMSDKLKLKQILINLLSNAIKYTDSGKIEAGCKIDNNKLIFYVSDTGIGIPSGDQHKIFERFYQVSFGNDRLNEGNGLGLSIAKGLAGLLGGQIWLESELAKGSSFFLSIPYQPTESNEAESDTGECPDGYLFSNKTLLIVEDDKYNADYLKEILNNKGMLLLHAIWAEEAIQISLTNHIDLILMDIRLPGMNGYEASKEILKHKPNIKIIAQTAYASHDEKQKAYDAGCIDYIGKPTPSEMLLTLLYKHLK